MVSDPVCRYYIPGRSPFPSPAGFDYPDRRLLKAEITEGDFSFIDPISYENCFHLINAGNYLELNHLFDLACAKIAAFMKGKNPEEVSEEFTFECQLTPDEAKQLGLD